MRLVQSMISWFQLCNLCAIVLMIGMNGAAGTVKGDEADDPYFGLIVSSPVLALQSYQPCMNIFNVSSSVVVPTLL